MVFVLPESEAESFYKKHARAVYRLALSIVKEPGEAEDVLQTVFMKALTYEGSLSRIQNPRAWLATVAKNTALNHLRSKGREMPSGKTARYRFGVELLGRQADRQRGNGKGVGLLKS